MKILLRIAVVAVAGALIAGCCNCRAYQKKARRPLVGTEWQLIQLGGEFTQAVFIFIDILLQGIVAGGVYCKAEEGRLIVGLNRKEVILLHLQVECNKKDILQEVILHVESHKEEEAILTNFC